MDAEYTGYHDVTLTDQELASLYENPSMNRYDMLTNEYLIVRNTAGEVVDCNRRRPAAADAVITADRRRWRQPGFLGIISAMWRPLMR